MNYMDIVGIIITVIGGFLMIYPLQYAFLFILGMCCKPKKYPSRDEKLRYGMVVAARNEEKVIDGLIDSIRKSDYPQDKLTIFVMAHNCTDRTAEIARKCGAVVFEYNNPNEKTKGYALKKAFELIDQNYGINSFDGYHIFDADNILDKDYVTKMNDAFLYYDKKRPVMGYRNAKNFGENTQTAMYGVLYAAECRFEDVARTQLDISVRLIGSGFVISSEMVKNGWDCVILSDDVDFSAEQVLKGEKVSYCNEATYYDEHPTTFKAMWRQRFRWTKGVILVGKKRWNSLIKNLFRSKKQGSLNESAKPPKKISTIDLLFKFTPVALLGFIGIIIDAVLIALAPLFGLNILDFLPRFFISVAVGTLVGYGGLVICPIACYIYERKRIVGVSLWTKIKSTLMFPVFIFYLLPQQLMALFSGKLEWKPIVHSNESNFETFNKSAQQNEIYESKGDKNMKIVVLSGGSGNDAMVKGLNSLNLGGGLFDLKVIVNAYDNGKSTGVCRAVTNTLGVSDIRKNHSRMYQAVYGENVDENIMEFYDGRFNLEKGREVETVKNYLSKWGMEEYSRYADEFFAHSNAYDYDYKNFSVSNIIYSQMYEEYGYEYTNKHFCDKLGIDDFVVLNSFDNVFIKAQTESGHIIEDEGETVFWNNPSDKIVKTIYDVHSSVGLNPVAVNLIENADLIIISTGTFYSSLQPTIEYLDFYKYINASNAKKIWVMNNEEDGDSFGVSDLDLVAAMERTGLDLDSFVILVNDDAKSTMKQADGKHNFVSMPMGNVNGKHDARKYAVALLRIYYGLDKPIDKILFDFDDTIYSRSSAEEDVSVENVKLLNSIADKSVIVSGNSYRSIRNKLSKIYGPELEGWNVEVWADANSILFRNDEQMQIIEKHVIRGDIESQLTAFIGKHGLKTEAVGGERTVNYKIKPLSQDQREKFVRLLNKEFGRVVKAKMTGKTTVDIVSLDNDKESVFDVCNFQSLNTLYVGDEVQHGNDVRIANRCNAVIRVSSVNETNIILKLLSEK